MTRTNKIKKKSSTNPKTHLSIKPRGLSGITKKKLANKLMNGKISSKLLKHIKTRKNSSLEQDGGFLGLDYIALRWKMNKFLNIVKKLNDSDVKFQKDIESYKLQAKLYEERANKKAELQTQFIDAFRLKQMYIYYQSDEKEAPKTKESKAIIIQDSLKILDNRMADLSGRINQLDKEIGKDMKEYNRLMKEFKAKTDNFEKITSKYSKISNFQQEIEELKRTYDSAVVMKQGGLSKADKNKVKKFEKHKEEYTKILSLTGQEIQNRIKIKQEIGDFQTTAEHYLIQFGAYEGKKKKEIGELDKEFKKINCDSGSGLLCKWVKEYTAFSSKLIDIDDMCGKIIGNMKNIQKSAEICVKNLVTVFQKYDKDPQPQAMLRFERDIIDLIKLFEIAGKIIGKLKAEFYKQTPAARINLDYNALTVDFNYLRAKLKVYVKMFDPNETDPTKDRKKTGGYRMFGGYHGAPGGRGGPGRGGPGRGASRGRGAFQGASQAQTGQKNSQCYYNNKELTNESFLKIQMKKFKKYKDLYYEIKDKTKNKDCFNDLDKFMIIFNNYYQVWLFWLNVAQNLNDVNTNPITDMNFKDSLKYFQIIEEVLENTEPTQPNTNDKWFWNDDLKESLRQKFALITHFEIPPNFAKASLDDKNLKEIFVENPSTDVDINTIRTTNKYDAAKDLVCKMNNNNTPSTTAFYGVEEWDAEIGTPNVNCNPQFPGTNDVFKNYLDTKIMPLIQPTDYPPKFDPSAAAAQPNPAAAPQVQVQAQAQAQAQAQVQAQAVATIQSAITKVQELKNTIDNNNYLLYQSEYFDFLDSIQRGLKKQEETGITAANPSKLSDLLIRLKVHIDARTTLSPSEITNYKAEIALYNGWYLQPLLNAYEIVKARYFGDAQQEAKAKKAAEEVKKRIESGKPGDLAVQEVINMDEFKDPKSKAIAPVPGAAVVPPAAGTVAQPLGTAAAAAAGAAAAPTAGAVGIGAPVAPAADITDKAAIKIELDATDANLIKDVRRRIYLFGDYDVQLKNITVEYEKIFKTFDNLLDGSSSIKKMSDTLQDLTQNLLELKYIEPKITSVTAKKDTSIRLPGADWLVPPAVKEFDKLHALTLSKELREAIKQNPNMHKIYEETTSASSEELRKLFEQILINAGDKNKVSNFFRVATNLDYLTKISDPANFNKIIEMLKATVKADGGDDTKNKVCNILNGIRENIGFADESIRKTMLETMNLYDPNAKDKNNPCFSEKKKDDKKDNKSGRGGRGGRGGRNHSGGYHR